MGIIVLAMIGSMLFFISRRSGGLNKNQALWQGIFLDNGEVYFGQVVSENADSVIIKNVYYPTEKNALQQGSANDSKNFSLIKLGNEMHGPFDEMRINRQHILFVEDLRGDSKAVKAIEEYQKKK